MRLASSRSASETESVWVTSTSATRSMTLRIRWTSPAGRLLLPVRADAVAQALRLADVDDVAAGVLHEVDAGLVGQLGEGGCEFGGHAPMLGQVRRSGRGVAGRPPACAGRQTRSAESRRWRRPRATNGTDVARRTRGAVRPDAESGAPAGGRAGTDRTGAGARMRARRRAAPRPGPAGAPFSASKTGEPSTEKAAPSCGRRTGRSTSMA